MNAILSAMMICATLIAPNQYDEIWKIRMSLQVPRVYDNTESLGYRKYQQQSVWGTFAIVNREGKEPEVMFLALSNRTHKVAKKCVTYETIVFDDDTLWHGIGNNLTGVFATRSVMLNIQAEPSYAIAEPTEDNSLIITLSGRGNEKRIVGKVSGKVGCACKEYGHTSPTRIWAQGKVVDTAAVFGMWAARKIWERNDK